MSKSLVRRGRPLLPTEDLFIYVYVLIHDLMLAGAIAVPARPGPTPACSDAELLAIVVVRHLLGLRSESGSLAEVGRDWDHLFPVLPHQSEANRRHAGCTVRSSRSELSWQPGFPRMTASRPTPVPCR